MKKFSLLLLFAFFIGITPSVFAADAINETFENFSAGSINGQNNWSGYGNSYADIVTDISHGGSKSLYLNGFVSNANFYTGYSTIDHAKNIVSFWYREASGFNTNDYGNNSSIRVPITVSDGYNDHTIVLNVCHAGQGHRSVLLTENYIGNGGCVGGVGDMTEGNWYNIQVNFDFANRIARARVDDGTWGVGVNLYIYGGESGDYIKGICMMSIWDNPPQFWFDDLKIFETPQLTVNLNPSASGTVTSSPAGIDCGADCQESLSGDVTLTATSSENWAFSFWDDGITSYTENPKTFTIDQNKTITAKFFKTFRASTGNFYANIGDTGGECVPYVRSETGIPWADFNGDAYTTYQQAINAGYKVSNSVPRVSSVIVFAAQGGMTVGHVAIITAINGNNLTMRDSNWGLDGKVSEHTVDVTNYTILGYIYPTP